MLGRSKSGFSRPILLVLALALLVLLAVDLLQLVRPSGLSAVACTATLFHRNPDTQQLIGRHRDTIARQARLHDLPGELVAAVLVDHYVQLSAASEFSDCFGSALGANLSLGLAQMRIGTAAELDGKSFKSLSAPAYRSLRSRLLTPDLNIAYEARELRALRDRAIRFPGMSAETLIQQPAAMALLITEYRMGRMPTSTEKSRLSVNAFSTLGFMQDGRLDGFGREATDSLLVKSTIRKYLSRIYCQSGMFNEGVCNDWRHAQLAIARKTDAIP